MYHGVRCLLPFDPHLLKRPANHPSFNEALNLRSTGQRGPAPYSPSWHGCRAGTSVHLLQIRELTRSKENAMSPSLLPMSSPPAVAAQPPRLLDQVAQAARQRGASQPTTAQLVSCVRACVLFHGKRHPRELGRPAMTRFLEHVVRTEKQPLPALETARSALELLYPGLFVPPDERSVWTSVRRGSHKGSVRCRVSYRQSSPRGGGPSRCRCHATATQRLEEARTNRAPAPTTYVRGGSATQPSMPTRDPRASPSTRSGMALPVLPRPAPFPGSAGPGRWPPAKAAARGAGSAAKSWASETES
jgi:hypothetical protein